MKETNGIIEQHIHGAFGCDFMQCSASELEECAEKLAYECGVDWFFPTLMTDSLEKIKIQTEIIKEVKSKQKQNTAKIAGIHLEGPFINSEKKGIHEKKYIQPLDINIYKQVEDEIIKIITTAPELDKNGKFISYLKKNGVKVSLGHSLGVDLKGINQVTHLYNAMGSFTHRGASSVVAALTNDEIYVELIADSIHVSDDVIKLTIKQKGINKILLISDSLPLAHSEKHEMIFAGQTIYKKDNMLVNKDSTIAGSAMLLCDIVKNVTDKGILKFEDAIKCTSINQANYHKLSCNLKVYWNDDNTIKEVKFN